MTLDELHALANEFFEWPEGSGRQTVSTFSALLFAKHVLEMQRKAHAAENNAGMDALRDAVQQALEALRALLPDERDPNCDGYDPRDVRQWRATEVALRAALEKQETKIPITDDHGKALRPQYRIIEQHGNWQLLYDQMQIGEKLRHEFRIQKWRHDIALYPGITLAEALTRFRQKVEADRE